MSSVDIPDPVHNLCALSHSSVLDLFHDLLRKEHQLLLLLSALALSTTSLAASVDDVPRVQVVLRGSETTVESTHHVAAVWILPDLDSSRSSDSAAIRSYVLVLWKSLDLFVRLVILKWSQLIILLLLR